MCSRIHGDMRLRVLILLFAVLLLAGLVAACGEDKSADQGQTGDLSGEQAGQAVQGILDALGSETAESIVESLGDKAAQAAEGAPIIAPLSEDFLDSLDLPAVDPALIEDIGFPLGERPTAQDFSYAEGLQIPSLDDFDLLPPIYDPRDQGDMPPNYDLETLGKLTAVKDQNPYGTCWSFAALGSLESWLLPRETWDLSEDHMVLNSGFDTGGDPYNWGGNLVMATAYLVRWSGPVAEGRDSYGDGYTPAELSPAKHVQEVKWIAPRGSALDNYSVKKAIMDYGGVYVAMSWQGSAAGSAQYDPETASYYYFGPSSANHAVLIVGWDDDYPASNFPMAPFGDGAFIVRNSWGTGFGDGGYFYVSYYDEVFGRKDVMAVFNNAESPGNYSGVYQYDVLGDANSMGYSSPTAWFANVFTARETSRLTGVGFYALTPGTSYEVYAGPGLADLTLNSSGTLDYMGYHTVRLEEPVALTRNQAFTVAVKVTSPGTDSPIAVEYPIEGYTSAATAEPGQSYSSEDGVAWSDLATDWNADANVCLKAYVN